MYKQKCHAIHKRVNDILCLLYHFVLYPFLFKPFQGTKVCKSNGSLLYIVGSFILDTK